MKKNALRGLLGLTVLSFLGIVWADGTFVPKYEERAYEGSLEQKAQEAIIVHKDGVEDLILKVTYQGTPQEFAWLIPFPSVPEISRANAELFAELFAYVEHALARGYRWSRKWGKGEDEEAEEVGVEVIARKTVGSYETTTVKETVKGALSQWLLDNGYLELKGAESELEYYRKLGWVFAAIKVREALAAAPGGAVDLHPLRFKFKTRERDKMVYPLKLSVFQKSPLDVNLYVFTDSFINIDYDEKGVLTKGFEARLKEGTTRWSHKRVADVLPMWKTRRFFLKNYARDRFCLTNIQVQGLKPSEIREWSEDLYIYPQYVYLLDPSTWYWPQWLGLFAGIAVIVVVLAILVRLRRKKKAAST